MADSGKVACRQEGRAGQSNEQLDDPEKKIATPGQRIEHLTAELIGLRGALEDKEEALRELQTRLDGLGRRFHDVATRLQHIEDDSFWRITGLLWRFIENRVFGRNFRFHLVPNKHLEVLGTDYEWRAVGHDPAFDMIPVDGRYPSGWLLIATSLQVRSASQTAKLYYDAGEGMSEKTAVTLPVSGSGEMRELVWLPRGVRQLRWDPIDRTGELTQKPIVIHKLGPIKRVTHRIAVATQVLREHDASKLRAKGITWWSLLFEPQRSSQALSDLREPRDGYDEWLEAEALTNNDRRAIRRHIAALRARPLITVLMPVYNTPPHLLRAAIQSVFAQLYENWELCIADDASTSPEIREILEDYRNKDSRVRVEYRTVNGHISAASNSALATAKGEFIALLDHDDLLSEQALYQVAAELDKHPETDILYSDEDKIDESGHRSSPYFKPDWNPELLLSQNYVSHLGVYRTSLVRAVGGFREGFEGSQDYDLLLRCTAVTKASRVRHIPAVLYHWRTTAGSTAGSEEEKDYATRNGVRALEDHFRAGGLNGVIVEPGRYPTTYRVRYPVPDPAPKISLIVPTRDGYRILRTCIDSIRSKTTYPNYEIVIVDNQSSDERTLHYFDEIEATGVRVLRYEAPFNYSAINNFAVERVDGALVGLINNDLEVISPDWLTEMASHALRPEIGAVGAKLYYADDTIQHAGVIVGLGGVAGHSHKHAPREAPGYGRRLTLIQNFSAVTAACLLVRRTSYLKVGGFDSTNLTIAFNDVDFCLRLCELGLRNVWTPYAELYHHESASRGADTAPEKVERFQSEIAYMSERWGDRLRRDPCYSPMLTLDYEDFRPNFNAAPLRPWVADRSIG